MHHHIEALDGRVCPAQGAAGIRQWIADLLSGPHQTDPATLLLSINKLPQTGAWLLNQLRTAELNDQLRVGLPFATHGLGQVCCTPGFAALVEPERFLTAIRATQVFHAGNDPYLEHDFGQVEIDGDTVFWKIDYYALDSEFGSEAPWDAQQTRRVLTLMLAEEY
ncbi:DUF3768 domain-containing protein [Chromobacterium sp. ASV23]|uniref:DUF3768 domain-containing protein n=1 Tax=Chromobacterium sp. ASV23 TaxID=2795110 RepID=UPI0018EA3F1A|nr:DUF3768 domain-containing protein [Chromobacterium sp. ASV23]